jgi:hypothetical protein
MRGSVRGELRLQDMRGTAATEPLGAHRRQTIAGRPGCHQAGGGPSHSVNQRVNRALPNDLTCWKDSETGTGIEPVYTDVQSCACVGFTRA